MRAIFLLLTLVTALLTQPVIADESFSVYSALVEIQTVDSIYSFEDLDKVSHQVDHGDRPASGHSERRDPLFGWIRDLSPYSPTNVRAGAQIESSGKSTLTPPTTGRASSTSTQGLRIASYTGHELEPDELPYIDAQGNKDNNYAIFLTATWCHWCHKMYKDTVEPLREEGFKIYIIDVDEFRDIKARIHRLDTTAEKMGRGVPYFVVREGGKTKKLISGYTSATIIRPHLKKLKEQTEDLTTSGESHERQTKHSRFPYRDAEGSCTTERKG